MLTCHSPIPFSGKMENHNSEMLLEFSAVVLALCLWYLYNTTLVVDHNQICLTELLGRFHRVLKPGLHVLKWPMERLKCVSWSRMVEDPATNRCERSVFTGFRLRTEIQQYDFPPIQVLTKEGIQVKVNGSITYRITDAYRAAYEIDDLWTAIEQTIIHSLSRAVIAMSLEQVNAGHQALQEMLFKDFTSYMHQWGVELISLRIQSIMTSKDIMQANEMTVKARLQANAQALGAESAKIQLKNELDLESQRDNHRFEKLKRETEETRRRLEVYGTMPPEIAKAYFHAESLKELAKNPNVNYILPFPWRKTKM